MTGSIRILHVDDDPALGDLAAELLEREDDRFSVVKATSASEGLELLDDVDCVVSDYDMPRCNGIEFLEEVRDSYPELPFILYTGKGSEEVASEAVSAGVTDYLQKESGTGQYTVLANSIANAVEQYRSKRELEASQKRLSLFIEQSPLGVLEYDEDFRIVGLNEAGEEILGYTEAELLGESWEKIVASASYENVDEVTSALAEAEGGYHSIDENVRKDGEHIICEWHNRLVTDEGDVVAVFSLFQDITERIEREKRLERTSARLEALFENSPDMINVHDMDGNLLDPNPQFCEKTGYDADELTEMKVWDVDQRLDSDEAADIWADMDVGDRLRLEGAYRTRDGETFPVEVHIRRLNLEGEDRFIVISRDISERKGREQALERQNQRLEEFASVVSHDLRNPLSVAKGNLELARENRDDEHLAAVARAHERMRSLIEDLLTLAREGTPVEDVVPVALPEVVGDCWEAIDASDATLTVATDRAVLADRGRLRQLVENLLQNAVNHGGPGVAVTVGDLDDGFYVADDGPGISVEKREKIFEGGYSTSADGTGFGLRVVAQIADAHDWSVAVSASAAGGARFEFTGVGFAGS